ncbi:MAG: serine/threonine protein phosphatase [Chitinophagaceae bacterium]|nr:serine/threonine protein phosphatase [Chitinophagaceae bacterium]
MSGTYIIGDIHGCNKTFRHLITEKIKLKKSDHLYLVGDYIDRGPDSKGVLDFILELRSEGFNIFPLRGNHEQMLLDSFDNKETREMWLYYGGEATLESYGAESLSGIDLKHLQFLLGTGFYYTTKNLIITHAGLNFDIDDPLEDLNAMLWTRKNEVNLEYLGKQILVHGHTPITLNEILNQELKGSVNIDGGCIFRNRSGMGHLVALDVKEGEFIYTENIDYPA